MRMPNSNSCHGEWGPESVVHYTTQHARLQDCWHGFGFIMKGEI